MRPLLIDTGPIVAAADSKDPKHQECAALFETKRRLVTTELVIAEVGYFFREHLKPNTANEDLVGVLCSRVADAEFEIHKLTSKSWQRMAEVAK